MVEIAFENGWISNVKGLMTLTLDRVIHYTVMHHSCTTTLCQISLKSKKLFVDRRTYVRTVGHLRWALLCRLCLRVNLNIRFKYPAVYSFWLLEPEPDVEKWYICIYITYCTDVKGGLRHGHS